MKLLRLSGRKNCDYVMRKGRLWKGRHFFVRWLPGAPRSPLVNPSVRAFYVGTVASTKLDKSAVKRNRMRRRCREALRISLKNLVTGHWSLVTGAEKLSTIQLLILPRSSSLSVPFTELTEDIQHFLMTLSHG
ncbi:MAG: hypothetical protein RIQ56_115 [Candidatus Parcubacteria bacterium]|jgi:ribonuclease P protein component